MIVSTTLSERNTAASVEGRGTSGSSEFAVSCENKTPAALFASGTSYALAELLSLGVFCLFAVCYLLGEPKFFPFFRLPLHSAGFPPVLGVLVSI